MEIVLIVGMFCALIFFMDLAKPGKSISPPEPPKIPPQPPPKPKRFVSVVFKEGDKKTYDYFFEEYQDLHVGDFVEVMARGESKIAMVKHVSEPGERSNYAWATVIRRVPPPPPIQPPTVKPVPPPPPPPTERFVQVIFKKRSKKRYDYLLGDTPNVHVEDFVVVHVNVNGKNTWKIAKVMYISSPGEISIYAKSFIIKKADYPKW